MKIGNKLLTAVLAVVLLVGLFAGKIQAAELTPDGYTYTVTFSAGNQGLFGEEGNISVSSSGAVISQTEDKVVVSGLYAGDEVGFTAQEAVVLDETSKYYVKGIRLSGRDNSDVAASVLVVEGDADYVVAYGIKGNQVSYTVNYQDEDGRELAESQTFYGNIGDKPVVAYKYIVGYAPAALGLTKTLSENAAENIFTFEYTRVPTQTVENVVTNVVTEVVKEQIVDSVVVVPGSTNGDGSTGELGLDPEDGEHSGNSTDREGTDESTDGEEIESGIDKNDSEDGDRSDEGDIILDLDDEESPLAFIDSEVDARPGFSTTFYTGIIMIAIATLLAFALVVFIKKKRDK